MLSINWKPDTIEEAMRALDEGLSSDAQKTIINLKEDQVIRCHMGLGMWIRNNWDLWSGGPLKDHLQAKGFMHPDDMSMSLIREWWARKNGRPSTMQAEIKKYAEYWEKK